jgi:hypothetical protein
MIKVKINVMKVDKNKLFVGKAGAKYLDVVLIANKDGRDSFGNDGMVVQDVSKEEREAGQRGAILGNYKDFNVQTPAGTQRPKSKPAAHNHGPPESSDVPL